MLSINGAESSAAPAVMLSVASLMRILPSQAHAHLSRKPLHPRHEPKRIQRFLIRRWRHASVSQPVGAARLSASQWRLKAPRHCSLASSWAELLEKTFRHLSTNREPNMHSLTPYWRNISSSSGDGIVASARFIELHLGVFITLLAAEIMRLAR